MVKKSKFFSFLVLVISTVISCAKIEDAAVNESHNVDVFAENCDIVTPPAALNYDPFYTKFCSYFGLSILSSDNTPDEALQVVWSLIDKMLDGESTLLEK